MIAKLIKFSLLVLLAFSSSLMASQMPQDRADFCTRFENQTELLDLTTNTENLINFKNDGGLFNAGVCWWHSRFQRNLLYLTIFKPELNRPKKNEIQNLIAEIRFAQKVITIPGFHNVEDFTKEYRSEILRELADWQLFDGIVLKAWITGIQGSTRVHKDVLKKMLDEVYDYVKIKNKIAYQKLQIKGITAHSWLVVGIKKKPNGYSIGIIDSNTPRQTTQYKYEYGNTSFYDKDYGVFVPYLEFKREEERLTAIAKKYCDLKVSLLSSDEYHDQEDLDIMEHNRVY